MTTFGRLPSSVTFQRLLLLLEGHRQRKSTIRTFYSFCRTDTLFRPLQWQGAEKTALFTKRGDRQQRIFGVPKQGRNPDNRIRCQAFSSLPHRPFSLSPLSSQFFSLFLPYSSNLACSLDSSRSIDRVPPLPPPLREIRLLATGKSAHPVPLPPSTTLAGNRDANRPSIFG